MPALSAHQSATTTKMLLIGDPGSGKTGALASLARAGYNLRILDCDNGLDILANILADDAEAMARVSYITCTDKYKSIGGKICVPAPTAWSKACSALDNWKTDTESFGAIETWGEKDILIIDSLTLLSQQALAQVLALNSRPQGPPQIQDWGIGMSAIEGLLGKLYSEAVSCNVILTAHITYIGEDADRVGYASTLGNKLPPKVGRYFNAVLRAFVRGSGPTAKRLIATRSQGVVALKTPSLTIPAEYPLDTGLASYFKSVRA
tara:strand:- start:27902 stop:28690 length:789 start_codon:yes stop_codon:yes gene_type:complete